MKRSIISSTLLLALCFALAPRQLYACAGGYTVNYYMFHIVNDNDDYANQHSERMAADWSHLLGTPISADAVDALSQVDAAALRNSDNAIVAAAVKRGDREVLDYLRALLAYYNESIVSYDGWEYPSKEEIAAAHKAAERIYQTAQAYRGTRLASRYALLAVRCLYRMENYKGLVGYWEQHRAQMPEGVCKTIAEGFYAGALYKLDRRDDACEIYARLGDIHSATWCMKDERNLPCIERLYASHPTSPALHLLVQDFVNNAQETLDAQRDGDYYNPGKDLYTNIYKKEVDAFVAFAERVAKADRDKQSAMWYSAAAMLSYLYGDARKAADLAERAVKGSGTPVMLTNARLIRLLVSTANSTAYDNYDTFLLTELRWLDGLIEQPRGDAGYFPMNAAQRIYRQRLIPLYKQRGRPLAAHLLMANIERLERAGYDYASEMKPVDGRYMVDYSSGYMQALDSLTADELVIYNNELFERILSPLDEYLKDRLAKEYCQRELYFDLIGTHYMREGRFDVAAKWNEHVMPAYLSAQRVSFYMAQRSYEKEPWLRAQHTHGIKVGDYREWDVPTRITSNPKLTFCRRVLELRQRLAVASAEARPQLQYELATLLFQGSKDGECWFLTGYHKSWDYEIEPSQLAAEALTLLKDVSQHSTGELHLRSRMARAYVGCELSSWFYSFSSYKNEYEFDVDLSQPAHADYAAFAAAARAAKSLPADISRCDVLRAWLRHSPDQ